MDGLSNRGLSLSAGTRQPSLQGRAGSRHRAADQGAVRLNNLALVLRQLSAQPLRSRASIAATTGLNKATVSSLVSELIDARLVREVGTRAGAVGRPARTLELDGSGHAAIGLEIDVEYVAGLARDLAGRDIHSVHRLFDVAGQPPEATIAELVTLVDELRDRIRSTGAEIAGIMVAVPGLVDMGHGLVMRTPNLSAGWRELPLAARLRAALGEPDFPVQIENDSNLSALAEYREGADARASVMVYVTGQFGVGGAVIFDGQLQRGALGFSGEVGHMVLDESGPLCGCGRSGCWEAYVGLGALLRRVDPDWDLTVDPADAVAEIVRRAAAGDEKTLCALSEVGKWLGVGASILANIFNPEVLVLGGYFARIGPWVYEVAMHELREHVLAPDLGGCRVTFSNLGFSAPLRGGTGLVTDVVLSDPGSLTRNGSGRRGSG
ncbi:MAG: ROK family protein [Chloroflexota bacterium]|nr:ROK family protein [Chloroflexota bacterium]